MKVSKADNSAIATANGGSHRRTEKLLGSAASDGSNGAADVSALVIDEKVDVERSGVPPEWAD
jgi:hypothetical protein